MSILLKQFVKEEAISLGGVQSAIILLGRDTGPSGEALLEVAKQVLDGANGVGGEKLEKLKRLLKDLVIEVRNSGREGEGILNAGVGVDYVQKEKVVPCGFGPNDIGKRCVSLDGDADRLVYFRSFILWHYSINKKAMLKAELRDMERSQKREEAIKGHSDDSIDRLDSS